MPHADSSFIPEAISSKPEFWAHVHQQLTVLLADERNWVTNLANASALIYNSLLSFRPHFGASERAVNWCGFYLDSSLFPHPRLSTNPTHANQGTKAIATDSTKLLLGPFCGKPACQFINTTPGKARGVCADAYLSSKSVLVSNVDAYPGHIACDGETKSEIVCPLVLYSGMSPDPIVLGVLDLDCLALGGFGEEDRIGLERIAQLVVESSDW